jgi:shikimate kinase
MTVLGRGSANGGVSVLHAAGLGKGCSIGIDLSTEVSLVVGEAEVSPDEHGILDSVMGVWIESGYPRPDDTGWRVSSEVPIGQGLKSSAALACAAAMALNEASWTALSDFDIVDIAVAAQRRSGCTITGSMDDAWAAISPGWKLVDPIQSSRDSVLLEGDIDEGLTVLIALRGPRSAKVQSDSFSNQGKIFERAMASLSSGSVLSAMSVNGMAVAAATGDDEALRVCNSVIARGAIAAGVSGSGPAIAIVCYEQGVEQLADFLTESNMRVIHSKFIESEPVDEEASPWG